ncbi:hypothetical protein [Brevibacterium jeotgali]|uniref:DUF4232 domain-containing protein n=1 Tax=Brevibacterium jeotgali TaxID=1262550 RepID=A0A2H1L0X6_9MICO|nr:hypothetical protein [Brevibacterium jeotgali]TWC02092.1 hypothetical protein FB108_0756 [Brevibacterium jeotgali]SMY10557.1 hypothetical protein BJEO58_00127 [Brevibacterium jeotgali]
MRGRTQRPHDARRQLYRRRRTVVAVLAIIVASVLTLGVVLAVQAVESVREGMSGPEPVAESPEPSAPGPVGDAGSGSCPPDTTRVAASTDEDEYEEDEEPVLTIAVRNTHSADCLIDVGTERQEFVIEHDGDTVWSSRYCESSGEEADGGSNPLVFPAKSEKKTSLDWPRIPVDDACRQTDEAFPAGQYDLIVKLGEEESEPARFTLKGDPTDEGGDEDPDEDAGEAADGDDEAEGDGEDAGTD